MLAGLLHAIIQPAAGASIYWLLSAILALGFTLRWLAVVSFPGAIDPEGAEYARLAENLLAGHGYRGIATPGKQLIFPPLFPLMIAAVSLVTGQAELAGRIVSSVMGTMLVATVFFIALHLYNRATASLAALLVAVHPYLVGFSSTVYCESTYLTLALTGVYWSMRALHRPRASAFFFAGLFFGLAYLTRSEAVLYLVIALVLIVVYVFLTDRGAVRRVALRSMWGAAAFLALAAPYVLWLYSETGQWRLEAKSPLNYAAGLSMLTGVPGGEAQYGVDRDLSERGVWNTPNLSTIRATDITVGELLFYLRGRLKDVAEYLIEVTNHTAFGAPPLFVFAVYGLFRRPWGPALAAHQALLFAVLGVSSSALFFIYYLTDRFLLLFVPVLVVWAANGIWELARWAASTTRLVRGDLSYAARVKFVIVLVLAASVPLATLPATYQMHLANRDTLPLRTAGEWLKAYAPGPKTVSDGLTMLSFHAAATFVPLPYADSDVAIRYLQKRNVDFVVLSDVSSRLSPRAYFASWMEHGVPGAQATLIYRGGETAGERIRIYELKATGGPDPGSRRG